MSDEGRIMLRAAAEAAEGAAPSPWTVATNTFSEDEVLAADGTTVAAFTAYYPEGNIGMDDWIAAYIAAAHPAAVIALLDRVDALEAAARTVIARDAEVPLTAHDGGYWGAVEAVHEAVAALDALVEGASK